MLDSVAGLLPPINESRRFHEVVAELLASPLIDVNARAERGLTALHVAAERSDERATQLLLETALVKRRGERGNDQRRATEIILAVP